MEFILSDSNNFERINRAERLYRLYVDGKFVKRFQVPEVYYKVMEDIENGKMLPQEMEQQIQSAKSYEAYQESQK